MRKKGIVIGILLVILAVQPGRVFAAGKEVTVALPDFKVTLNGVTVDNNYSQYPLIVYDNITYFPMTYSDCRFLGVESVWKGDKDGLFIDKTGVTAAYSPYKSGSRNSKSYTATVPQFPIKVNGQMVNNSKEAYPLISFRNITYFPMTWQWGVEKFRWDYHFDNAAGLVIQSDNIKVSQSAVLQDRAMNAEGQYATEAAIIKGYIYYEGTKGRILRASLSDAAKASLAYQLEIWRYGDGKTYVFPRLDNVSGEVLLSFHQGGAAMGGDWQVMFSADGTKRILQKYSYHQTDLVGNRIFYRWVGTPGAGNLRSRIDDNKTDEPNIALDSSTAVGPSDYYYAPLNNYVRRGMAPYVLRGDDLYLLASEAKPQPTGELSGPYQLCKVNLKSNVLTPLGSRGAWIGQIEGDYAYYVIGNDFYRVALKDAKEEKVGTLHGITASDISLIVMSGKPYWRSNSNGELYRLGDGKSLNPEAKVDGMTLGGNNDQYLICTFEETPMAAYRLMIFDRAGNMVFKTSDKTMASNVTIEDKTIYYFNHGTGTVCQAELK